MDKVKITHNFHGSKFSISDYRFIGSNLIKMKTNDKYYHASTLIDNYYYEAVVFKGVIKDKKPSTKVSYSITFEVPRDKQFEAYYDELNKQVGKGYDYKGALLGFFGFKIQDSDRYYCNELNNIFLKHYSSSLISHKTNYSPKDLRLLLMGWKYGAQSTI